MTLSAQHLTALRDTIASWLADASSDAHGVRAPTLDELYAPASHAAALDPASTIVRGARGTGKSFWAGVLERPELRNTVARAYPRLGLDKLDGQKKGNTYDWPYKHLGDTPGEVTPRSFLALLTGAALKLKGSAPAETVISPDGIRHGLRLASKMRVDQLHLEFKWIKGVLAPLAGLLLPATEKEVLGAWKRAGTVNRALDEASRFAYLPPFPKQEDASEQDLVVALEKIFVMSRRGDDRLDMPDLFRVAAKLLKKGAPAPL